MGQTSFQIQSESLPALPAQSLPASVDSSFTIFLHNDFCPLLLKKAETLETSLSAS
jgi:hypothetical protein